MGGLKEAVLQLCSQQCKHIEKCCEERVLTTNCEFQIFSEIHSES